MQTPLRCPWQHLRLSVVAQAVGARGAVTQGSAVRIEHTQKGTAAPAQPVCPGFLAGNSFFPCQDQHI